MMRPEFQKNIIFLQTQNVLGFATPMQETESGQNQRRAFDKSVGPRKIPKLINLGPMFIPEYRVRKYVM